MQTPSLAFASSFIHFLSPLPAFHSTAACHLAGYLITFVGTDRGQWIHSRFWVCISGSPATDMALTSNQPHRIPSIRPLRVVKDGVGGWGGGLRTPLVSATMAASLGAVEAHLECPAVKLIMSSFRCASENTSSPPGTMKLHMASPILRVWHQVCVSGTTNFETPNVSILLKEGKAALAGPVRMGEPEVRFVFLCGEERNSQAVHTRAFRWQPPVVKCCLRGLPEPASPLTITTRPWRWLRLIGWHTDWARGAWKVCQLAGCSA